MTTEDQTTQEATQQATAQQAAAQTVAAAAQEPAQVVEKESAIKRAEDAIEHVASLLGKDIGEFEKRLLAALRHLLAIHSTTAAPANAPPPQA